MTLGELAVAIVRSVNEHFTALPDTPPVFYEGQLRPTTLPEWAEIKIYGPFFDSSQPDVTVISLQLEVHCFSKSKNIYAPHDWAAPFMTKASESIFVEAGDFCLANSDVALIEKGAMYGTAQLRAVLVRATYSYDFEGDLT